MDRRLPLMLLLLLPCLAFSQTSFSLPGVGDLQKQLTETSEGKQDGSPNPERETLEKTLEFRQEIDSNQATIEELETFAREAPSKRTRLEAELTRLREERDSDWQAAYADKNLKALVTVLVSQLDALETNQSELARANSELTRAQTLPEQAQKVIGEAMDRINTIRSRLNNGTDEDGEPLKELEIRRLQTEQKALESRIERYNQELSIIDRQQDIARLEQQLFKLEQNLIEQRLDAVQPLINERRTNQLEEQANAPDSSLSASVLEHPQVQQAMKTNQALRKELAATSDSVNQLLRTAVDTKTQLDKARSLSATVNDQIRMLDGSLLLSRILYKQQKSLPQDQGELDLEKQITESRLRQFEIEQHIQGLDDASLPLDEDIDSPGGEALDRAFALLREERLGLYDQLDQELTRQLAILTRTQLNHDQLRKITQDLHNTISEQTFWMPSNQPLSFHWLGRLPAELLKQVQNMPWQALVDSTWKLFTQGWAWLIGMLIPSILLLLVRPKLKERIAVMNRDVGSLRRDSQIHTPVSLLYTFIISAPVPVFLALLGSTIWLTPGTFSSVIGSAFTQLALLWLVFEVLYRLLKNNGIAQRHFRWDMTHQQQMRRRMLITGLALVPMMFIIAFGDQWPAQLSNDRLGLVIMLACLGAILVSLPAIARAYPGRHYSAAMKTLSTALCGMAPLALIVLTGVGYYYTSVRLAGHMIFSLYLVALWILLDATAVRGLAVAAQRLAYKRAVAQRESEQKDNASSEAVEVEEPQLDLKQVNQQSLRLIRLALVGVIGVLVYWVWADVFHAFAYTDKIVLWETADGTGAEASASLISLGDVIASLVIGAVTFLLASNLPGLLEVLVLSRLDLRQGTSYATTTLLSYVIVASGLVLTLGALGLSWDKMQWLVAALGVGLGFGLQEIFANFMSGIILLFERPIRIGDVITINNLDGTVSRIRIRATTLIDFDRKEILVPNKVFVTERLINWSLSDTVTRVILKVGFAYGSDLEKCRDILLKAARNNRRVLRDPEPVVLFMGFGASTLDHELRVHVDDINDRLAATDELNRHIDALCKEQDVEIAFSQLDIHIRTSNGEQLNLESHKGDQGNDDNGPSADSQANDGKSNQTGDPK